MLSGLLAAVAGLVAKLGLDGSQISHLGFGPWYQTTLRLALAALTLLINALMITLYTKALSLSKTAIEASLVNTSANLVVTGLAGHFMFGELLTLRWWCGSLCIVVGGFIVNWENEEREGKKNK